MSMKQPLQAIAGAVADGAVEERAAFLAKTYGHLAGAVFAWVFLMVFMGVALPEATQKSMVGFMLGGLGGYAWLLVLGAFMVVSTVAHRWAASGASTGMQYVGLGVYVVAQAAITYPLVYIAAHYAEPGILPKAAGITLGMFVGLTAIVFYTRKDFSFMRGVLGLGMLVAMGLIVSSIIFGFQLGIVFTVAMIGLMCGYILYETSAVLHHFRSDQYVSASLVLFASLATLFWYVLQLLMSGGRD